MSERDNPREVFGILENGPKREYPIEIIEAMAESGWSGTHGVHSSFINDVFNQDSKISEELNKFTADMLAKLGIWTYYGNFTGLTPDHATNNTYEFIGAKWKFADDDVNEHWYDVPTRNLGTTAFNCSDYLMGSGSGSAAIRGSDMHFINKYMPSAATAKTTEYLNDKSATEKANFKQIFKEPTKRNHTTGDHGYNMMGVYRPFSNTIYVGPDEVSTDYVQSQEWSYIGNRLPPKPSLGVEEN